MYVSVCSAVCMLDYTTWQVQSPVGWRCCILHLAEHIRHIRGVTNPFLTARTFQRVFVTVNNTSSGFHTSERMCVWHTDTHTQMRWSFTQKCVCVCVCVIEREREGENTPKDSCHHPSLPLLVHYKFSSFTFSVLSPWSLSKHINICFRDERPTTTATTKQQKIMETERKTSK